MARHHRLLIAQAATILAMGVSTHAFADQKDQKDQKNEKDEKLEPWQITGVATSTGAQPSQDEGALLSYRRFQKKRHLVIKSGFSYLSRGDFYRNPGISLEVSWYPFEFLGIDFLSGTVFFSQLRATAEALRKEAGLLPDSQKPIARATAGARFAFIYGKMLVELLDTVVHFDLSVGLHLGVLVTDRAPNFGGDLGLGFQIKAFEHFLFWADLGWWASFERRSTTSFDSGLLGSVGLGLLL